jgi:hypothetical protein
MGEKRKYEANQNDAWEDSGLGDERRICYSRRTDDDA